MNETPNTGDTLAEEIDRALAQSRRADDLRAHGKVVPRTNKTLRALLEAMAESTPETMMDADGMLVGSTEAAPVDDKQKPRVRT